MQRTENVLRYDALFNRISKPLKVNYGKFAVNVTNDHVSTVKNMCPRLFQCQGEVTFRRMKLLRIITICTSM